MSNTRFLMVPFALCAGLTSCDARSSGIHADPREILIHGAEFGQAVPFTIWLENRGRETAHLQDILASCSCTIMTMTTGEIDPGARASYSGTLTSNSRGPQKADIEFLFSSQRVSVPIRAYPSDLEFFERSNYRFWNLPRGTHSEVNLSFFCLENEHGLTLIPEGQDPTFQIAGESQLRIKRIVESKAPLIDRMARHFLVVLEVPAWTDSVLHPLATSTITATPSKSELSILDSAVIQVEYQDLVWLENKVLQLSPTHPLCTVRLKSYLDLDLDDLLISITSGSSLPNPPTVTVLDFQELTADGGLKEFSIILELLPALAPGNKLKISLTIPKVGWSETVLILH